MNIKKKNLALRILIAAIFAPAILFMLYSGGVYLLIFLLVVIFGLTAEFSSLPAVDLSPIHSGFFIGSALAIPLLYWLGWQSFVPTFVLIFSAAWFLLELLRPDMERSLEVAAFGVAGIVLFGWIPSLTMELADANPLYAVLPMALVWVADTAAYFAGNLIGGPKMTPNLSPHKTWAGFVGEIVGAAIVGIAFRLIWPELFGWNIIFFALPAGIIAVFGDLFESKIKRGMKIKDSSSAIPGHGGIWDRFDSWLFVSFWAWVWFLVM